MAVRNGHPDAVLGGLYPFQDRYVTLDDGTTMHYVEMGSAGFWRPTILLLHGNPTWSFLYRDWIAALSRIGRVVAVDTVGFGRSDHPRDPKYHTLERHIANLREFADKTHLKRVVPVMQDWGGPIGLGYATKQPEDIRGLVVMNTWASTKQEPIRMPLWSRIARAPRIGEWFYGKRNAAVERFLPRLLRDPPATGVMAGYRHPFPTPGSRQAVVQAARMVPDKPSHPDWATLDRIERALPDIQAPACVLWGAHDPVFPPRHAWAFAKTLRTSGQPHFFANAGHWPQEDVPNEAIPRVAAFARSL